MILMGTQVLLSIVLSIIFLVSAVPKLHYPKGFVLAVLEYRILPPRLSWLYARLLPQLEFLLALLLLSGMAVRSAAVIMSVLLLSFIVAVGINLTWGRDLDCHCFDKAPRRPIGWMLLLQDGALLGAALALAALTREWIAPETWSVLRLLGLVQAGSFWPLLGCAAVTACSAMLLSRSTSGKRRYGSGVAGK